MIFKIIVNQRKSQFRQADYHATLAKTVKEYF